MSKMLDLLLQANDVMGKPGTFVQHNHWSDLFESSDAMTGLHTFDWTKSCMHCMQCRYLLAGEDGLWGSLLLLRSYMLPVLNLGGVHLLLLVVARPLCSMEAFLAGCNLCLCLPELLARLLHQSVTCGIRTQNYSPGQFFGKACTLCS